MLKDDSDKPNWYNSPRIGCAGIVILIVVPVLIVYVQVFIDRENKNYCWKAENDAKKIAAEIADYFSVPEHTQISTADVRYKSPQNNTFTITATDPSLVITITVTDGSGRCPEDVQKNWPGWDGNGVFTKVLSNN